MHPPELRSLLGYEFFKVDPENGKVRELDERWRRSPERIWYKLDDLGARHLLPFGDIRRLAPAAGRRGGHCDRRMRLLSANDSDLREQHDAIKRDLQQHGCTVLPAQTLPQVASELREAVREDLARCRMSIHMVGRTTVWFPEGCSESLVEIQYDLASQRAQEGKL